MLLKRLSVISNYSLSLLEKKFRKITQRILETISRIKKLKHNFKTNRNNKQNDLRKGNAKMIRKQVHVCFI